MPWLRAGLWLTGLGLFALPPFLYPLIGPLPGMVAIYAALIALGLALLPRHGRELIASPPPWPALWRRAWWVIPPLLAYWALVLAYGAATGELTLRPAGLGTLGYLALHLLCVGLAEELYFRETALRVLGPAWIALPVSAITFGLVHLASGWLAVGIAFAAGCIYLGARLAGVPVLVLALAHGVSNTVFGQIVRFPVEDPLQMLAVVIPAGLAIGGVTAWLGRRP